MNELCVTFPKSLEAAINKSESEVIATIKEIVALELYKKGEISLGNLESDLKTLERVLG